MYALMWMVIVPVIWQLLAIWHKTLVPPYLGLGMSLLSVRSVTRLFVPYDAVAFMH